MTARIIAMPYPGDELQTARHIVENPDDFPEPTQRAAIRWLMAEGDARDHRAARWLRDRLDRAAEQAEAKRMRRVRLQAHTALTAVIVMAILGAWIQAIAPDRSDQLAVSGFPADGTSAIASAF